jgi:predicted XRE-type DNA-binding protein
MQMKKREKNTYASVWDALADTPEQAANLQARADLVSQIVELIQAEGWKQVEALVNIAAALGRRVSVELEAA